MSEHLAWMEQQHNLHGEIFAYWEQGWEGMVVFAFQPDNSPEPVFLKNGYYLTIYNPDHKVLWSGRIHFVARRFWDTHNLPMDIWSDTKQKGVSYAQWLAWFSSNPSLRADLRVVYTDFNAESSL